MSEAESVENPVHTFKARDSDLFRAAPSDADASAEPPLRSHDVTCLLTWLFPENSYEIEVAVVPGDDANGFWVYCPTLPGLFAEGKSQAEAVAAAEEAAQALVESYVAESKPIPWGEAREPESNESRCRIIVDA